MRTLYLTVVFIIILAAGLTVGMIYAAHQGTVQKGVTTARCDRDTGQVMLSIGGTVYVAEEDGDTRAVVEFDHPLEITDLDLTEDTLYVGRGIDRVVTAVPLNGQAHQVAFQQKPISRMTFQLHPFASGRFAVSDTLAHRIRLYEANGQEVTHHPCMYPNAILPWNDQQALVLCTGTGKLRMIDDAGTTRNGASSPGALTLYERKRTRDSHYEMDRGPQNSLYVDSCRYAPGIECDVHRFEPDASEPILVARLAGAHLPTTNLSDKLREVSLCSTRAGTLIIASDRFGEVFEFSNGKGGPPGPMQSGADIMTSDALMDGSIALGPDNQVRRFGDTQILEATQTVRARRHTWYQVETAMTLGLYGVLILLCGILALIYRGSLGLNLP